MSGARAGGAVLPGRAEAAGSTRFRPGPAWLIAPAIAFLAVVYLLPVADLVRLSLSGAGPRVNFGRVFATPIYWDSLVRTLGIAGTVALLCLLLGYPTALAMSRTRGALRGAMAAAIVLPYFLAVLIRTYAWMVVLGRNGPVNKLLGALGLVEEPVQLLFGRGAVLLAMTAVLLPLMVLTLYGSLSRIDGRLVQAALAGGAGPTAIFWRVILPLTLPGAAAGALLVFVSALGFFITPTLLGGPTDQMFAMHVTQQADFLGSGGFLQALAVVLLVITLAVVALAARFLGLAFIWGGTTHRGPTVGTRRHAREGAGARTFGGWAARGLADGLGWPLLRRLGALPRPVGALFTGIVALAVVATLILPVVVVAILSFGRTSFLAFPPPGYSLRWYAQFVSDPNWMAAFGTSVGVAAMAAILSVVLGGLAAVAVVRAEFRAKTALMALLVSPLIVPPVVLGLSLYGFFLRAGLVGSPLGLAAAHAIGGIPLVVVLVAASLQSVDRRLEQAAAVHGAPPWKVLALVTVPAIAPGLAAAAFFAFLHSLDELVLSLFLSGPRLTTLPLKLWGDINYQLNPVLAVVSTLEVLLVVVGLALARPVLAGRRRAG